MNGRVDKYIHEQKEKIQAAILRGESVEGSLPVRIIEFAMKEPVIVDSILFDGYMKGLQNASMFDMNKKIADDYNKKPEES